MTDLTSNEVLEELRAVPYPGTTRNIVSAGFVKDVAVNGSTVLVRFAPNTTNADKVAAMEGGIRDVLYGASFALVEVETEAPYDDSSMILGTGSMNPLQAEMLEDGVEPQPDVLLGDLSRSIHGQPEPHGAVGLRGQGTDAEDEPPEPQGASDPSYDGPLQVLQWEIDPHDLKAESVQRAVTLDGWEFRVWWQVHAGGELLYTSLQALREDWVDLAGVARSHPVGRTEAVNLVYDRTRDAVIAIYGTVRDFRPFVEAFRLAYAAQYGGLAVDGANIKSYGPGSDYGPGLSYETSDEEGCCGGEGGCGCSTDASASNSVGIDARGMDAVEVARAAPAGEAEVRR